MVKSPTAQKKKEKKENQQVVLQPANSFGLKLLSKYSKNLKFFSLIYLFIYLFILFCFIFMLKGKVYEAKKKVSLFII